VRDFVRGRTRWARASTGRWVRTGGEGVGVRQCKGLYPPGRPLVRDLQESGVRQVMREGKSAGSLAAAGLTVGGEQTTLRAARRRRCLAITETGGRQLSMLRTGRGVERKQLVTHLWTEAQKTSMYPSWVREGAYRSAP
jgi:hypothetical protein